MSDQLREAARALLAVVDEREPGMRGYYIASERFAALRAALDAPQAEPPRREVVAWEIVGPDGELVGIDTDANRAGRWPAKGYRVIPLVRGEE